MFQGLYDPLAPRDVVLELLFQVYDGLLPAQLVQHVVDVHKVILKFLHLILPTRHSLLILREELVDLLQ